MGKKLTFIKIQQEFINRNLIPLFDEYKNNHQKLLAQTKEGYKVIISINHLKSGHMPNKFGKSNPYTIQNIKFWCKLENKSFDLLDNQEFKGNNKKLKWQCLKPECREIFEATWGDIQSDKGCPYCAGVRVGLSNCLAIRNPKVALQWHPTLNGDLTPYNVTCGSHKEIWWKCDKGHEWKDIISNRSKYIECPYCNHQRVSKEYNLLVCNPELANEWNYEKNDKRPEDYTPNSNEIVYWKCKECSWEWPSTINNRNNNNGCPKCANFKGEKNPNWQGGQTEIKLYLRSKLNQWKLNSLNICNYKCIITGLNQKDIKIHHLVPFSKIFKEIWETSNLPKYQTIGEYTNKELLSIIDLFNKLHDKYGLGVCLSEQLHIEFHKIYGRKNFTPENFYEFYKLKTGKDFNPSFLMPNFSKKEVI